MTGIAIAVLHGYDPRTGKVTTDEFREAGDETSPWHRAQSLKRSVEDDFPGWVWSVGQNIQSRYLMYVHSMRILGLGDDADSYDEWLKGVPA